MPTTTTKNGKVTTHEEELLKLHAQLIAEYPAKTGAAKAQTSRRINLVQLELDLLDVEFTFWQKPSPTVVKSYIHDPDELLARIAGLRKQVAREDRPEVARATADRELTNALAQAASRGIEVPDAPQSK